MKWKSLFVIAVILAFVFTAQTMAAELQPADSKSRGRISATCFINQQSPGELLSKEPDYQSEKYMYFKLELGMAKTALSPVL